MRVPTRGIAQIFCTLARVFLLSSGSLYAQAPAGRIIGWGDSSLGQTNAPSDATNIAAISAKGYFSMGMRASGQVVVWGITPAAPGAAANSIAVSAGEAHCLALTADR